MGITGREVWDIGWMMIKHLLAEHLEEMCWRRVMCGQRPGTDDEEFRSALYSVHSKTSSQTAVQSAGAEIRASIFNSYNDTCTILREKFYPGPGREPGPLAFRANALTN